MSDPEIKYTTTGWEETPAKDTGSSLKITRVRTERDFTGKLVGKGVAEYVMVYHGGEGMDPHTMGASYNGLMIFKGSYDGRPEGEVTFMTVGSHSKEKGAVADWTVDPRTATGGFKDVKGTGGYAATSMGPTPCTLQLAFD